MRQGTADSRVEGGRKKSRVDSGVAVDELRRFHRRSSSSLKRHEGCKTDHVPEVTITMASIGRAWRCERQAPCFASGYLGSAEGRVHWVGFALQRPRPKVDKGDVA